METYLYAAIAPDTFVIVKMDPLFIGGNRLRRTVVPALTAQLAQGNIRNRPLDKMPSYESV